jgi:hypothetical protein
LIALCDVGVYNLWVFDNASESAGMNLAVAADHISFAEIAKVFTKVTGKPAAHQSIPWETYATRAEPYPGAPVNWTLGPDAVRDDSTMTWLENFRAFWRYWGGGISKPRDTATLDRIHPKRIKSVEEWMRHVGYDGKRKSVLKQVEDWANKK